ncbi:MAG: hypothetical protein K0S04_474 [Herbinix sp.]|jgi:hypothetical protein|nr:hypothetical protein [Herbinix sp.]
MDLNNSHVAGYQSGKSQISRSNAQNRAIAEPSRKMDSSSAEQGWTPELKEGQIIRGQVLDHRYNEVTIQLEPGKQILTAKLTGDIPLSIGQEAVFTVTGEASGSFALKYLPANMSIQFDTTIGKALTASGFPLTDRNKALVAELLAKRLPIDKQTLQVLLRVALANQEASPQTLVLMYKNNIPLTPANIKQFEAYQNGTHQLVKDLQTITQNISVLPGQFASEPNPVNHQITTALQTNQALIDILNASQTFSSQEPSNLSSSFNQTELNQLSKLLEQYSKENASFFTEPTAELLGKIQNGTLSLRETAALFTGIIEIVSEQELQLGTTNGALQNAFTEADLSLITKLMDEYDTAPDTSPYLSKVLTARERLPFVELLKDFPGLPNAQLLKDQITKGSITLKELIPFLQEELLKSDKTAVSKLIQLPEYAKLLEAAFLEKWSISPKKFADKSSVTHLLNELSEDLSKLHNLAKEQASSLPDRDSLQNSVQNLRENLQFMKDLNQVFPYLQLPVQFKNHSAHTELYILTKKKAMGDDPQNLSVLLHLEMSNLGSLNIFLQMSGNKQIQADFYTEDKETGAIIKEHLESLTSALLEKSYILKVTVSDAYSKPDFSKDFIEQSSLDNNMKRYTFDIRT